MPVESLEVPVREVLWDPVPQQLPFSVALGEVVPEPLGHLRHFPRPRVLRVLAFEVFLLLVEIVNDPRWMARV